MEKENIEKIVFAGGCFWGTQHFFKRIKGILSAHAGYANSEVADPDYALVCTGKTGAAEAVEVTYDAAAVDLPKLIVAYFSVIDPFAHNRQGNDVGTQYRTGIYYTTDSQRAAALREVDAVARRENKEVAVEVLPLKNFYKAEPNHQDYLEKNPNGYCHIPPAKLGGARHIHILKEGVKTKMEDADTDYAAQ